MDRVCRHCKTKCGRIVGRGLGAHCYYILSREGRLEEYPKISRAGISYKPVKYVVTPEIHERIREVYQTDTGKGQVAALALSLGMPKYKIYRYAVQQGWTARHKKEPDWRPEELRILKEYARHSPRTIQRRLLDRGYRRSEAGIVLKRKRLGMLRDLGGVSATRLAVRMGVDNHNIIDAIKKGLLPAERRLTNRTAAQGGDIWFIRPGDIRDYIINNIHDIDIRKVDKYWFVELLAGTGHPKKRASADATMQLPFGTGRSDRGHAAPPPAAFDEIHTDDDYFHCDRMNCTLRKAACVRRQTEPPKNHIGSQIVIECKDCEQGRQIAAELGVTVEAPRAEDRKYGSMIHRRTYATDRNDHVQNEGPGRAHPAHG